MGQRGRPGKAALGWTGAALVAGLTAAAAMFASALADGGAAQPAADYAASNVNYAPGAFWWKEANDKTMPQTAKFANARGQLGVINALGPVDTIGHPFFTALGTNGRACVTCHQPADGMSLSVDTIKARWAASGGKDPMFAAIDGSDCPSLPQDKAVSHSLLLKHGLFRISLPWPPKDAAGKTVTPEFTLQVVKDPTGCNTSATYGLHSAHPTVSVYRRPRPTSNLRYVTSPYLRFNTKTGLPEPIDPDTGQIGALPIMSDSRDANLKEQAIDATLTHLQGTRPTDAQLKQIVDFESQVYMAEDGDKVGGAFTEPGGPRALGAEAMLKGKTSVFGNNWTTPVFYDFESWRKPAPGESARQADFRASVARGYDIFMTYPIWINDVAQFNSIGMGNPYKRNCAVCHNLQLMGTDISPGVMDLGMSNLPLAPAMPDLPLFKLTCRSSAAPHPYLGRVVYTHDPGRALISGKCDDIGALVMQQLRGLAARAPYFSNGSAATLADVVEHYDTRFKMHMSSQQKQDLTNFLSVL